MARRRLLVVLALAGALFSALAPRGEGEREPRPDAEPPAPGGALLARLGDARLRRCGADAPVFNPDGTAIAAGGDWRADVIEWHVATGAERRRYSDGSRPAQHVSVIGYTPDGDRLLVRIDLARVVVFDTATGAAVCRVENVGAMSSDLRAAAARGTDGVLRVWSLETGRALATLDAVPAYDLAFSWDGHWLAAGHYCEKPPEGVPVTSPAYKGIAWVWPAAGGPARELKLPGEEHSNGVSVVWVRPDRVLAWTGHHMAVFDAATGGRLVTAVPSKEGEHFFQVFTQDGRLYVREWAKHNALEYDPDTLKVKGGVARADVPFGPVLSPDGSLRAERVGGYIRLVDVRTGKPLHPELDSFPTLGAGAIHFSADGRRMLTSHSVPFVWDLPSGTIQRRLGNVSQAADVRLSADGRWVAGPDKLAEGQPVVVWDAETGAEVGRGPLAGRLNRYRGALGFDPGGGLWVRGDDEFTRYEVPSGRLLETVSAFGQLEWARLSPDGAWLASAGTSGLAVRRTTGRGAAWQTVEAFSETHKGGCGHTKPPCPHPVCFSHDGRQLLVGCGWPEYDGWRVRLWTPSDPPAGGAWIDYGCYPNFTPDGRLVVAGVGELASTDAGLPLAPGTTLKIVAPPVPQRLRACDPATGAELFRFDPGGAVSAFAFTPDGTRLVVAHPDTTLTVWDWAKIVRTRLRQRAPTAPSP